MNKKLLGVVIPLIILIVIIILSVSNIGYSFSTKTLQSIKSSEINQAQKSLKVQEITITNKFILPRGVELPNYLACVFHKQTNVYDSLRVEYREVVLRDKPKPTLDYAILPFEEANAPSLDIGMFETKKVELFVTSPYNYKTEQQYWADSELLLVKPISAGWFHFSYCHNLNAEQKSKAVRIPIVEE